MFKQIYRFLSIFLISNFLFTQTSMAKIQKNPDNSNNKKNPIIKDQNREKMPPYKENSGYYTPLYGVMNLKDFHNSYIFPNKNPSNKQNGDK